MKFSIHQKSSDRRKFVKQTILAASGVIGLSNVSLGQTPNALPNGLKILFQGDSITDAGRDRSGYYANHSRGMGNGYVYQAVSDLLGQNPSAGLKCYNRGISGHKVFQLANRWEDDCLQLKPDVLSILIGVNDFWHTLSHNYKGTAKTFDSDLRALLSRTKEQLPNVKLILCEPFAVAGGSAISEVWFPTFNDYQKSVKSIAADFDASFVPFQKVFDEALKVAPVDYWCPDGVHPSIAGSYLMKEAWMGVFNQI